MTTSDRILAFADRMRATEAPAPAAAIERELHLVTFDLGAESYAVPIAMVREIVRLGDLTRVPNAPPHIRGVMNLRGRVLPVVELRTRLGLPALDPTPAARIVVAEVRGRLLGYLVDRVAQVTRIGEGSVTIPPDEVVNGSGEAITGIARKGERLLLLLELERVLESGA
jgi:purine-binding chemotaxis protein CheW